MFAIHASCENSPRLQHKRSRQRQRTRTRKEQQTADTPWEAQNKRVYLHLEFDGIPPLDGHQFASADTGQGRDLTQLNLERQPGWQPIGGRVAQSCEYRYFLIYFSPYFHTSLATLGSDQTRWSRAITIWLCTGLKKDLEGWFLSRKQEGATFS